jgi:hypothetical protein
MHTFKDTKGEQWTVDITIGAVRRVKAATGEDLLQPEKGEDADGLPLLTRLALDDLLLGEIVFELLRPEMESRGLTEDDLAARCDGTTIAAIQEAFYADLIAFFEARGRVDRAAAVRKQVTLMITATKRAKAEVERIEI